jgi:imidazolonepropionase
MLDLIITHASELITLAGGGPRRGSAMRDLGIVPDGAVRVVGGRIASVGATPDIVAQAGAHTAILDAGGCVVMPGFVDAHTHLVFAGDRAGEFEQRLRGATYLDILAAGGGILSTVRATRQASHEQLSAQARQRLAMMLAHGTTTVEAKSGYGLDTAAELKMLAAARELAATQPVQIVSTFMGAHAVPPEFSGRADDYVNYVIGDMLPRIAPAQGGGATGVSFCDVFCDQGAFTLDQARRVLQAAKERGLGLKIHADEFSNLGGAHLAAELGATSAEHLAVTPANDVAALAAAGVMAVLLPGTTFGLASSHYANARALIAAGVPVALGSDLNPGTCYCGSMPFIIALACRYLGMTAAEAICAATINAAWACGVGRQTGSIEPGKRADIIILDTPDHRRLGYRFGDNPVTSVIAGGDIVWPMAQPMRQGQPSP